MTPWFYRDAWGQWHECDAATAARHIETFGGYFCHHEPVIRLGKPEPRKWWQFWRKDV